MNAVEAHEAAELVRGVMRGDPATFKLGYSIGNALIVAAERFKLDTTDLAIVAEAVVDTTTEHSSPTRRPLVIVGVGGGLVQWTIEKHGLGTPRVHVLDHDREDASPQELEEFIEEIKAARGDLEEYRDPLDAETIGNLTESITEYTEMIEDGFAPGRYR
jgi:hypothetical protein